MGKKVSHSVYGEPSGKGIMEHSLIDLNVVPANVSEVNSTNVLPPPPSPRLYIDLCFTKVDLEVLRQTYKVLESPNVGNEHLRNLGFSEGGTGKHMIDTYMCTRDKKAQIPTKALRSLARTWFKEVFTKKNQDNGDKEAKKYLPEHIEVKAPKAPKAPARMARTKRVKVYKQVSAIYAPRSGKNKSAPKPRSLNDIVEAIELLHGI